MILILYCRPPFRCPIATPFMQLLCPDLRVQMPENLHRLAAGKYFRSQVGNSGMLSTCNSLPGSFIYLQYIAYSLKSLHSQYNYTLPQSS